VLSDLDVLMRARGIGMVVVPMHEAQHASFRWMTGGAKVTRGYAVKRPGHPPLLIAYPMEREEAAATGLAVRSIHDFGHEAIFRSSRNLADGYARFFGNIFRDVVAEGSIAFFGNAPVHLYAGIIDRLEADGWNMFRGDGEDLIQLARKRKDPREVETIRDVGRRTEEVVQEVRELLRARPADLRIGDIKELVTREIGRRGLIEDHETIVSHGRDAAIPHSRGDAAQRVEESVPIVIDIFPADRVSGYFFDLTRTFCVGSVPDALRAIHADVLSAFDTARREMRPGTPASTYQSLVCGFFESRGYPTTRSAPATTDGYVHSLGHGVGLDIHERPFFSLSDSNRDQIEEGDVLTIEPGLYFPDRGIGVRIEDTFVITKDGAEPLSHGSRALEP
jgi:Xaa-Pro aminopeptidase